jgi:2'-5' RNA ligase
MTDTISKGSGLKLRTFIALSLPHDAEQFLSSCVSHLKKSGLTASFTKPGNFHLTLKFLGDTDESIIPGIASNLDEIVLGPMEFAFTQPGVFPKISNPRVVWQGIECEGLASLARAVDRIVQGFGFEPEEKDFVGHLTLARIKNEKPKGLKEILGSLPILPEKQHFVALEFIKSELNPAGSIYTPLWRKELGGH